MTSGRTERPSIFTWRAVLLAPALVPLLASAAMSVSISAQSTIFSFLFFFLGGSIVSYGTTLCLLLPCLWIARQLTTPSLALASGLGLALGILVYVPVAWLTWTTSGVDSGPPEDTFLENLVQQAGDGMTWFFLGAGLVTAAVYWLLLPRRSAG